MLTTGLLAALAGLAALDSLNPATIAGVALILLAPVRRPVITALAYVAGAYLVVFAVGTGVFIGSGNWVRSCRALPCGFAVGRCCWPPSFS